MAEKNKKGIKNFAAGKDEKNFSNNFTIIASNELELISGAGKEAIMDDETAKRFGILGGSQPDLIIEASDNEIRPNRETGEIERILDGKPALIAEKNGTVVIIGKEALDRIYRVAELIEEKTKKERTGEMKEDTAKEDETVVVIDPRAVIAMNEAVMQKASKTKGRKSKQDREQEDR